jgi:heme oxygenase
LTTWISDWESSRAGDWRVRLWRRSATLLAFVRTHRKCPELLIAHAYTRYLGDLSGGQILRRIAAYALRLEGPAGLRFYEFSQIPNIEEFKHQFRQRLDELPLAESMLSAVVAEAVQAFTYSGAIFEAQRQLPAATEPSYPALLVPP